MKKYLSFMAFAMMAVFSLAFVSCDDDDEDDISSEATIVGTWEVTYNSFSTSIKEIAGFEIGEIEVDGFKVGDRITFFENGTYKAPDETGKWSKAGNTLRVLSDEMDDDVYTFTSMTIKKLTAKELELSLSYEGLFDFEVKLKRVY